MAEQEEALILREKDYEFLYKSKKCKTQPVQKNPLLEDRSQSRQGKKQQPKLLQKKIGFADPLTQRKSMMPGGKDTKAADPLSRQTMLPQNKTKQNVDPLSRSTSIKKPQSKDPLTRSVTMQTAQSDSTNNSDTSRSELSESQQQIDKDSKNKGDQETFRSQYTRVLTIKTEEKKEEGFWQEVRNDFVKIFNIRSHSAKMDQLVTNPFGSSAITQEDRQLLKLAQSGENKCEYDNSQYASQQKQQQNKITVKNYLTHLQELHKKMKDKWIEQDKVATLQITIQSIKLLIDNENAKFAPIKYVYIIDILETFSSYVFLRMKKLSFPNLTEEKLEKLNFSDIMGANIPESAAEICRNWLIKIGSIRELIPRIYIEAALLPIYYFIDQKKIKPILMKLIKMNRAMGDYINAIYYGTYILRIGAELLPKEKSHLSLLIGDFFTYMRQGSMFSAKSLSSEEYMELFEPFLVTAFRYYCNNCQEQEFFDLFELFKQSQQHQEVLKKIVDIFPANLISIYSADIFTIIQNYCVDVKASIYALFLPKISVGVQNSTVLDNICQLVWIDLNQVKSLNVYLNILAPYIDIVQKTYKGFQKTQTFHNVIEKFNELFALNETNSQATPQQQNVTGANNQLKEADIFSKLETFLQEILINADDVSEIMTIEPFLQFISIFPHDMRSNISRQILKIYLDRDTRKTITDPIVVHSLMSIAKNIKELGKLDHEGKQEMVGMINRLLNKINFGKDLEQMLNLYTEIRATFGSLPEVIDNLIHRVIDLTFKAKKFSKNKTSKKVLAFLQACVAFCYITIPMIENYVKSLNYYVLCSQIALIHNLKSQSEAIFKTGVNLLIDLPEQINNKNVDELLNKQFKNMISFMIVIPDDPEREYLQLFSGFYQLIEKFKWNKKNGEVYKLQLLLDLTVYLCVQIQEKLPYSIDGVISNDGLYAEPEFKQKILEKLNDCIRDIQTVQKTIFEKQNLDIYIIQVSNQSISALIQYFKPCKQINQIIEKFIQMIQKKQEELNKDKIGKIQLNTISQFTISTLYMIDRNGYEIKDFEKMKNQIISLFEPVKN